MVTAHDPIVQKQPAAQAACESRDVREVARAAVELLLGAVQWAGSRRSGVSPAELTPRQLDRALRVGVLRAATWHLAEQSGLLEPTVLCRSRLLASSGPLVPAQDPVERLALPGHPEASVHENLVRILEPVLVGASSANPVVLGTLFEALLTTETERASESGGYALRPSRHRKRTGSYYTPERLVQTVVEAALRPWADSETEVLGRLTLCDPALGGGAFLLEAGRQLLELFERRPGATALPEAPARRASRVTHALYGVDVDPLAVAVTEASLWLWIGDRAFDPKELRANLRVGDALNGSDGDPYEQLDAFTSDLHWPAEFPAVFARGGFDIVLGNPPWVAYAGRASQGLDPARRRYYAAHFASMRGYPTLHGLFVERAARLAPRGVLALLVPSPVADLDGYRAVRRAVTERHMVREPLLEFGQDAFAGVTQPCFALVADPDPAATQSDRAWTLVERTRARVQASTVDPPALLDRLAHADPLPSELFGEMGFQTTRQATATLLRRAQAPDGRYRYPLLEGKNVREFQEAPVRLYLCDEPDLLRAARCRLRSEADYQRVRFVVRQTARVPIAALHSGQPFRNSLLAGFDHPEWPPPLVVGLLNSALYRALHLALRRDARQAAFPQVKIAHLRALPRPPERPELARRIVELAQRATAEGITATLRETLDTLVFDLFDVPNHDRQATLLFLRVRAPELGHSSALG